MHLCDITKTIYFATLLLVFSGPALADQQQEVMQALEQVTPGINRIFDYHPQRQVSIRIVKESELTGQEKSPDKLAAVYYQGALLVAVDAAGNFISPDLEKTLRHEYVHAVVADLAGGLAPAWLDEGLAQVLSGAENPQARAAMIEQAKNTGYISIAELNENLLLSEPTAVLAAYGESFMAVRSLLNQVGLQKIAALLRELPSENFEVSFEKIIGKSLHTFDSELTVQLQKEVTRDG